MQCDRLVEAGEPGLSGARRMEWARRGRDAEVKVARRLRDLGPAYRRVHGLPVRWGDADHIVIGPSGVFVIDTKGHRGEVRLASGAITVRGRSGRVYRVATWQVRHAAGWVQRCLHEQIGAVGWVQAVLCFADARLSQQGVIDGVLVTRPGPLRALIRTRSTGKRLTPHQVARAYEVLTGRLYARRLPARRATSATAMRGSVA